MQAKTFKKGEMIITQADDGRTAFLITSGRVEVMVATEGLDSTPKVVASLGPGEVFGEMSLIEPAPRSASVRATEDTECIETSYDEFIETLQSNPQQAVEFMKTLVRRLRLMNELVAAMDPKKRRWHEILLDWQSAVEMPGSEMSEEDRKNYYLAMYSSNI